MTTQQPEALRIADEFRECLERDAIPSIIDVEKAVAELCRQHARIAELEAQLEAVGAGGVSGPLMGRAAPPTAQAEGWTKPHRTVTYTCPVCAASLERQE